MIGTTPINLRVAIDSEEGSCCPHCHDLRTKLVHLHNYKQNGYVAYAYQCTSCGRIVWGTRRRDEEEDANGED